MHDQAIAGANGYALDVRDPHEWREDGVVPGAIQIPLGELADRLASIPRDGPVTRLLPFRAASGDRREPPRCGWHGGSADRARGRDRLARDQRHSGRRGGPAGHVGSVTSAEAALGEDHARSLDAADPLAGYRDRFLLPAADDGTPKVYLAGQSLGAQPVTARAAVEAELDAWARLGVDGWFARERAWIDADDALRESTARLVGARPAEVATLNTLTVNLHLLLATFFRPSGGRTAILIDAPTFPSDRYAVESQLRLHGLDPARDLIVVRPRDGEALVRHEDLDGAIHENRGRLAVALLAGVNYATGQVHDIARLTAAVHDAGAIALWDLAHAAGNVPLALHDANVDGAAWCTYKYLNAGPGAIAQLFVHERHATDAATVRLSGWWGNEPCHSIPDGRDLRAGRRRRRLADLDAADPVAGARPGVARDLRRGRYGGPARTVHCS